MTFWYFPDKNQWRDVFTFGNNGGFVGKNLKAHLLEMKLVLLPSFCRRTAAQVAATTVATCTRLLPCIVYINIGCVIYSTTLYIQQLYVDQ